MLGAVFLRGFGEAIGLAVVLVIIYLLPQRGDDRGRLVRDILRCVRNCSVHGRRVCCRVPDVGGSIGWIMLGSLFLFPKLAAGPIGI